MRKDYIVQAKDTVVVTGSNGFIGAKVVDMLLEYGFQHVRCFVRPSSLLGRVETVIRKHSAQSRVKLVSGDLTLREDCARAAAGASVIFHLAAGFDKSFAGAFMNSALSTRNLMDAFLEGGCPLRFVSVSSFAVYSNLLMKRHAPLDESSPLEDRPQERYDAYGFGKLKQEEIVREYGKTRGLPYVILRPGTVFGPGRKELTGRIGINTFGFFIHVAGSNLLPLSFVDNCAEAIVLAGLVPGVDGEVFNVVDDELLTSSEFLRAYKRKVGGFFSLHLPYFGAHLLSAIWEEYSRRSQGQLPPAFNRRRCAAEWRGNQFPNRKIRQRLGWKPRVGVVDAMGLFLNQFEGKAD